MSHAGTSFLMSNLGINAPVLLVYLVAFILALVYLNRFWAPALLTLVGAGVLGTVTLGIAVAQAWLIESRQANGGSQAEYAWLMWGLGMTGSVLRAVGLGLLVAAIFVGRRGVGQRQADARDR